VSLKPQISVLMAVFNGEQYLGMAIDSILNQTYSDFEFIIIDDCSTDNTSEILKSYHDERIKLLKNEINIGLTKSLNVGLNLAKGEYIARQDADDISHSERLQLQLDFFRKNNDVMLLGTQARSIDEFGNLSYFPDFKPVSYEGVKYQLFFGNPFIHSTVMYRADIVKDEFGGYNESFRLSQDLELWSKIIHKYKCMNLNAVCLDFRQNPSSVSKFKKANNAVYEENFKNNIAVGLSNLRLISAEDFKEWPCLWIQLNVPYPRIVQVNAGKVFRLMSDLHERSLIFSQVNPSELRVLAAINFYYASRRMIKYSYWFSFLFFIKALRFNFSVLIYSLKALVRICTSKIRSIKSSYPHFQKLQQH